MKMGNTNLLEMAEEAFENLTNLGEKLDNGTYKTRDISVEELCMVSDSLDVITQLFIGLKDQVLTLDEETQEACMSEVTKQILKAFKENM